MSAQRFLFWLKGYLNACEIEGVTYSKDHIQRIEAVLELAIVAEMKGQPMPDSNTALKELEKLY
jgi:hypothetical protein